MYMYTHIYIFAFYWGLTSMKASCILHESMNDVSIDAYNICLDYYNIALTQTTGYLLTYIYIYIYLHTNIHRIHIYI